MDGRLLMRYCLLSSSLLGGFFIWYASGIVPPSLLIILVSGELAFIITTITAFIGLHKSYLIGLIISILVLGSSAFSQAHLQFLTHGRIVESSILLAGNGIQLLYISGFIITLRTLRRIRPSQHRSQHP